MKNTNLKNDFLDFIKQLKMFYLHGNEIFWTNFMDFKNDLNNSGMILVEIFILF